MLVAGTAAARAQAVRDAAAARLDELLADLAAWVDTRHPERGRARRSTRSRTPSRRG